MTEENEVRHEGKTVSPGSRFPFEKTASVVYLTAAFSLIGGNFLTRPGSFPGAARWLTSFFWEQAWFGDLAYWALSSCFFYIVPPTVAAAVFLRKTPLDLGLGLGRLPRHLWVYGLLLAGVLPLVVLSSWRGEFQLTYPFNREVAGEWHFFLVWEVLYVSQFFALEYFFRGFLLFPLEKTLGKTVVLVMAVPYAMIHFQKPFLEANGAVFAGLILGWMALRTRSVWGGVLLHGAVAVTMDVLALSQCGFWPPGAGGGPGA